jgi:hypothetical protein
MKKILYALLALSATLTFASCAEDIKEENGPDSPIVGANTISFKLAGAVSTRSASGAPASVPGVTIPVGEPADGQQFYLEETVTNLDEVSFGGPETKGTPVYTENFSKMSGGSFKGLAFSPDNMDKDNPFMPEGAFTEDGSHWKRDFPSDPWGTNDALLFYAKMALAENAPNDYTTAGGVLSGSYTYLYSAEAGQSMTFSYRSPMKAEDQQDLLFAARTITKAEARTPFPLLFYHALTGVKFATAHKNGDNEKVKTYIKKVEFTGIYGYGKCTVKPVAEDGGDYVDAASTYSSASAISWSNVSFNGVNSKTAVYSQAFDDASVTYANGGSFSNNGEYPESFSAAGNEYNLNDADGSMTFWFVPQSMTDDVKVKITFVIEVQVDGESTARRTEYTRDVDFGTLLNKNSTVTWKPGQLRTYTLKAEEVDVDIHDDVSGFTKDNVVITNTGNVDAYIRALIVANWWGYNAEETEVGIAMGYNSDAHTAFITPWKRTSLTGDNYGGVFDTLPGADWKLANDGYFYYTNPVAPGEKTGSDLFLSYNLDTSTHPVPRIWYFDGSLKEYKKVFLQMEIPVQAIEAKSGVSWDEAWEAATGTKPVAQ